MIKMVGISLRPNQIKAYSNKEATIADPYDMDGYYLEMDSFINSIVNGTDVAISGEDGKNAVALCLAAMKSAEEERVVKMEEILK